MKREKSKVAWKRQLKRGIKDFAEKTVLSFVGMSLIFTMCSVQFLFLGINFAKAAGSGEIELTSDDAVEAGSVQDHLLIYEAHDDIDGPVEGEEHIPGYVKITLPGDWQTDVDCSSGSENVEIVYTSGSMDIEEISCLDSKDGVEVEINEMNFGDKFKIKFSNFQVAKAVGDYEFEAKTKLPGEGDYHSINSPDIEVIAADLFEYEINPIGSQVVGVDFPVEVTALDQYGNETDGGSPTLSVKSETGTTAKLHLTGSLDLSTGSDSILAHYEELVVGLILEVDDSDSVSGEIEPFDVDNLSTPTFSSPSTYTNDSIPLIKWGGTIGENITYDTLKISKLADSGVACDDTAFNASADIVLEKAKADFTSTTSYQLEAEEVLAGTEYYCSKIVVTDEYDNTVSGYKKFYLSTANPDDPSSVSIPESGTNPINTINIYNYKNVSVETEYNQDLSEGRIFLELFDELGNIVEEDDLISDDNTSGSYTTTLTGIDDSNLQQNNNLTLRTRLVDAAGNQSDWETVTGILKDIDRPNTPTVSNVTSMVNIGNEDSFSFKITGEDDTTYRYSIDDEDSETSSLTGMGDLTGGEQTITKDISSLSDGKIIVYAWIKDAAWNESERSGKVEVIKDATAPDAMISYNPNRDVGGSDELAIDVEFTENMKEEGVEPTIAIDYNDEICDDLAATSMTKDGDVSHWTYTLNVPDCSVETTATVTITGQDLFDNPLDGISNNTFDLDNVAPATPTESTVVETPTNDTTPNVEIKAELGASIEIKNGETVLATGTGNGATEVVLTLSSLTDGTYNNVKVTATDEAGNVSSELTLTSFVVDTQAPTIEDNYSIKDGEWVNEDQTVTLTPVGADTVKYCEGASCDPSTGITLTNPWSLSYNSNQDTIVRYQAFDNAGNQSAVGEYNVKMDRNIPDTSSISIDDIKTNSQTIIIPWTATDATGITESGIQGVKLYYSVNGGVNWTAYDSGNIYANSPISFTAPQAGTFDFYARAIDNAGNEMAEPSGEGSIQDTIEAIPTTVYVDGTFSDGSDGDHTWNWDAYSTIQDGINAVDEEGTVNVYPGTYTENVEINVPNLTLQSTDGRDVTIVDNPSVGLETAGISVLANMGTVTVDGFTTDGFRNGIIQGISQSDGTVFIVKNSKVIPENNDTDPYLRNGIQVTGDNSQVIDNYVVGAPLTSTWASSAIGVVNASNVLVQGNTVNTASADIGINVYNYSNVTVENITIDNNTIIGADRGIRLGGASGNLYPISGVTITNNVLNNGTRSGIQFFHVTLSDITIQGNEIHDNDFFGIEATSADLSGILVEDNEMKGHWAGIYFYSGCVVSGDIDVIENAIYNNSNYHFANAATGQEVKATQNWWGSNQKSDIESQLWGSINFDPWYLEAEMKNLSSSDTTGPTVVLSDDLDGRTEVKSGDEVNITATFEDINGLDTGVTPTITITASDASVIIDGVNMSGSENVWTYAWTVPAGDTTATVSVTAEDIIGNEVSETTGTTEYDIDNNPPTIAVVAPVSTPTNNSTPSYTFSSDQAGIITYGGSCSSATSSATADNNTIAFNTLTSGTYDNCTIQVTDVAGNGSNVLNVNTFTVDLDAPTITSVTSTDNGSYKANDTINVTVNFSENVTLAGGGSLDVTLDTGDVVSITTINDAVSATGTYTIGAGDNSADLDSTGIVLNGGTLRDVAGNDATVALPDTTIADGSAIVVDTTAPTVTITSPSHEDFKGTAFTIEGTSSDGSGSGIAGVEVLIEREDTGAFWDGDSWETAGVPGDYWLGTTMAGDDWSYALSTSLTDTTYYIDARATDDAGNVSVFEADGSWIDVHGDVSEPTSAITNLTDASYINSVDAISGTASDGRSDIHSVTIKIKDVTADKYWTNSGEWGAQTSLATSYDSNAGAWVKNSDLPSWESGKSYTIYSTAFDNVDNSQSAPDSVTFTFDNTSPTVVLSDDQADNVVKNGETVVITATFTEADQIDESTPPTISIHSDPNLVTGAAMTKSSNLVWTYSWVVPAGNDGTHTVSISAQDRAGNANTAATGETSYVIDNTNPTSSITDPTEGQFKKGTFTITSSATDVDGSGIARVKFYKEGIELGEDNNADGGYTYNWVTDSSDDGSYALTAVSFDIAGNSTISGTVNITVDNTIPTEVSITNPVAGEYKKGLFTISATASDAIGIQKVEFYDGNPEGEGATLLGTDTTNSYSYDWSTSALDDGSHTLYAKAYDNADNNLVSSGVAITVDNTTPVAPTYNSLEGLWNNSNPSLNIDFADNVKIDTIEYKVNSGGTYRSIATDVNALTYTTDWTMHADDWDGMAEGTNYLYFRITDYAGNQYKTGDNTAGFMIKKDETSPNAPTYNTVEDQWFDSNPTLDIDFNDANSLYSIEYQLNGTASDWTTLGTGLTGSTYTNNWSVTSEIWDGLAQGQHYIYFKVVDDAGNNYTTPSEADAFGFKKDTEASTAITGLVADPIADTWTTDNTVAFNWDDSTDAGSGLAGYSYELDHMADTTPDTTVEGADSNYTSGALTDGDDWYFHVRSVDNLGNASGVSHIGPFKIDTTDPSGSHSDVETAEAGQNITVEVTGVSDTGSGIASVTVDYKYQGDDTYDTGTMTDDGSGNYSFDIPDEENSEYDVDYHIKVTDNTGNETKFPSSGDYTVDITPAGVDHFTFIYPLSGTRYAGTWFTTVVEARDVFDNVVADFDGAGETVNFSTDEGGVSVFVQETGTNESGVFIDGVWAGSVQFGQGGGITPSGNDILLTATDSDNPGKTGTVTMTTSGSDFGTTAGALVEGANNREGGDGGTGVQGAKDAEQPVVTDGGSSADQKAGIPWRDKVPYALTALGALAFVGFGFKWWNFPGGPGSRGGTNLFSMLFSTLKTAATKIRMFLF
jgi:hypothetical protein